MSNHTPEIQAAAIDMILTAIAEFRPGGNYDEHIHEAHPDRDVCEAVSDAMAEIAQRLEARETALYRQIHG